MFYYKFFQYFCKTKAQCGNKVKYSKLVVLINIVSVSKGHNIYFGEV